MLSSRIKHQQQREWTLRGHICQAAGPYVCQQKQTARQRRKQRGNI